MFFPSLERTKLETTISFCLNTMPWKIFDNCSNVTVTLKRIKVNRVSFVVTSQHDTNTPFFVIKLKNKCEVRMYFVAATLTKRSIFAFALHA